MFCQYGNLGFGKKMKLFLNLLNFCLNYFSHFCDSLVKTLMELRNWGLKHYLTSNRTYSYWCSFKLNQEKGRNVFLDYCHMKL